MIKYLKIGAAFVFATAATYFVGLETHGELYGDPRSKFTYHLGAFIPFLGNVWTMTFLMAFFATQREMILVFASFIVGLFFLETFPLAWLQNEWYQIPVYSFVICAALVFVNIMSEDVTEVTIRDVEK